jgi:uncharacterized integral membrane protein (TIGR02327 family)
MDGATQLAFSSLGNIIISLASILFCWWILQGIRVEVLIKKGRVSQARALLIVLAIIMGHLLASFFIDYLGWSKLLGQIFS